MAVAESIRGEDAPLSGLRRGLRSILTSLQEGRMVSVLSQMDDRELAAVGIARRDIPEHAERLVRRDADAAPPR